MKVLNAFAGLGGNRYLWDKLGDMDIYAVEHNHEVAKAYLDLFPNDSMFVADAWEFIQDHFRKFDIIWASPPCVTHTRMRKILYSRSDLAIIPDMRLYGLIIFLQDYFKGNWVIENTVPFYDYLIEPVTIIDRHPFWSNVKLQNNITIPSANTIRFNKKQAEEYYNIPIPDIKMMNPSGKLRKETIYRNLVHPKTGHYVMKQLLNPGKGIPDYYPTEGVETAQN